MEKVKLTKRQDEMLKNHRVNLVQLSQIANHPTTPTKEEIAEEKERRWWHRHGRGVEEFKENDIISYDDNTWGGIYIVYNNIYGQDAFGNRLVKVCNQHMHKGRILSFRANELKVVCFAENREDVKE